MKNLKLLFSSLTVTFAIIGLTKALSTNITMPIAFVCLASTMFITSKEYRDTAMNKVTGLLLFLCPIALSIAQLEYIAIPVCTVATISAIQEWIYIIAARKPSK